MEIERKDKRTGEGKRMEERIGGRKKKWNEAKVEEKVE